MARKRIDLTGLKVGHLKVLSYVGRRLSNQSIWKCQCDCGNFVERRFCNLTSKSPRKIPMNCGCLGGCSKNRESLDSGRTFKSAKEYLYGAYKNRVKQAKARNLEFKIPFDLFDLLTSKDCFYCGEPPRSKLEVSPGIRPYDSCVYNGLDRVDSNKGYLIDNVVTCCGLCNRMKNKYSVREFLDHVRKIQQHQDLQ